MYDTMSNIEKHHNIK